ncbi:MAG: hypothetical protein WA740_19520 [Candidatus Binataceae bacterium]
MRGNGQWAAREADGGAADADGGARDGSRAAYVERHRDDRDAFGSALVVHDSRAHARKHTLGAGTVELKAPRVNDRRRDEYGRRQPFSSRILPP